MSENKITDKDKEWHLSISVSAGKREELFYCLMDLIRRMEGGQKIETGKASFCSAEGEYWIYNPDHLICRDCKKELRKDQVHYYINYPMCLECCCLNNRIDDSDDCR
jgi:hypothetical protein